MIRHINAPHPAPAWLVGVLSLVLPGLGCLHLGRFRQAALAYLGGMAILLLGLWVTFRSFAGLLITLGLFLVWTLGWVVQSLRWAMGPMAGSLPWLTRKVVVLPLAALSLLFTSCGLPRSVIRNARFRFAEGYSTSMEPTMVGEELFVWDAHAYRHKPPERMEVICFQAPDDGSAQWVKRVVALAGDVVEFREGRLHVNGAPQGEYALPGALPATQAHLGPLVVPEGSVYCLGDNGATSYDSRFWGPLPEGAILGKVLYVYYSKGRLQGHPMARAGR